MTDGGFQDIMGNSLEYMMRPIQAILQQVSEQELDQLNESVCALYCLVDLAYDASSGRNRHPDGSLFTPGIRVFGVPDIRTEVPRERAEMSLDAMCGLRDVISFIRSEISDEQYKRRTSDQ